MSAVIPEITDLSKYIELRPYGEEMRPFIRGRKLPVSFVGNDYVNHHNSIAEIAWNYTISEEQVLAGVLYYLENKDEIEAQDEADHENWLAMKKAYGTTELARLIEERMKDSELV